MQVTFLIGLANTSRCLGDTTAATQYLATATAVLGPWEPTDPLILMRLELARGMLDLALGQTDAARAQFARASVTPHGKTTPIDILPGNAEADLLAGNAAASAANARAALTGSISLRGDMPWSLRTGLASLVLGRAQEALGNHEQP